MVQHHRAEGAAPVRAQDRGCNFIAARGRDAHVFGDEARPEEGRIQLGMRDSYDQQSSQDGGCL